MKVIYDKEGLKPGTKIKHAHGEMLYLFHHSGFAYLWNTDLNKFVQIPSLGYIFENFTPFSTFNSFALFGKLFNPLVTLNDEEFDEIRNALRQVVRPHIGKVITGVYKQNGKLQSFTWKVGDNSMFVTNMEVIISHKGKMIWSVKPEGMYNLSIDVPIKTPEDSQRFVFLTNVATDILYGFSAMSK